MLIIGPPEDNVQSTVPTSEIVKGETEEISQQQTYKNDETVVIDTDKTTLQQGIEDGGNFDQQEATKIQLLNEEVKTTLPTPAFVQVDTDQISQQQSLHNDESKAIVNGKGCIPEIEHDREYTVAEVRQYRSSEACANTHTQTHKLAVNKKTIIYYNLLYKILYLYCKDSSRNLNNLKPRTMSA